MTGSAEIPRNRPKMAQGRKAGERPPDDLQDLVIKHPRKIEKLKLKKIKEIIDRENQEN